MNCNCICHVVDILCMDCACFELAQLDKLDSGLSKDKGEV